MQNFNNSMNNWGMYDRQDVYNYGENKKNALLFVLLIYYRSSGILFFFIYLLSFFV